MQILQNACKGCKIFYQISTENFCLIYLYYQYKNAIKINITMFNLENDCV